MAAASQEKGPLSLKIGIVGAGIAGLAAAAALVRQGHEVDLYEQSRFTNEIGAAVNVGPNAAPVLHSLGFDIERAKFVEVVAGFQYDAVTMKETYRGSYEDYGKQYKAPWYFSHRVDLHNEFRRLALEPPEPFRGAELHLSKRVVDVNCESGEIHFADATSVTRDVVVGADGVHSIIANRILGSEIPAVSIGQCAFRFLIPTEKLIANETTRPLFENHPTALNIAAGSDRRIVWYPCRNGEIQNFAAIHPEKTGRVETEGWDQGGSLDDLLQTYADFNPIMVEVCRHAENLNLWKLLYRAPISRWTSGKAIIIGDAAHPMLPHQGQGANQAIEDGGAIGVALSSLTDIKEVPARLKLAQDVRRNRASAMQIFSNAGQDESHRIEKEAAPFVNGPVPKNQGEFHKWNFGYDVMEASREALANL